MIPSFFLCIIPLLSACTPQTYPPVSIVDAITDITDDLSRFHTLGMIDVTQWTPEQISEFKDGLRAEQCRQHTPDPIIIMLRDNILLKLTGQFSATGSFSVGSAGMGLPSLSAAGSKEQSHSQELDVPIYMTPLSLLADYTYLQQVDRYKSIWNTQDGQRNMTYGAALDTSHGILRDIVQETIVDYPNVTCAAKIKDSPTVLFGTKKPK